MTKQRLPVMFLLIVIDVHETSLILKMFFVPELSNTSISSFIFKFELVIFLILLLQSMNYIH